MQPVRDVKCSRPVRFWVEADWKGSADLSRRKLSLGVGCRSSCIRASEIGRHAIHIVEAPIVSDVVVVGMRIHNADGELRQSLNHGFNIAYPHSGVEQNRLLGADDEIRDHFFKLMRLINGVHSRTNLENLEPWIWNLHPLKFVVLRTREALAPVRRLRESGSQ